MRALGALGRGIGVALARPGLLAVLALADLGVALVAVAPTYAAMDSAFSRRADAPTLARGFDFVAWLDLRAAEPGAFQTWPYAMAAALVFAWIWGALCAAGWLSANARQGFWAGIGKFGGRFARLALLGAACLVVLGIGRAFVATIVAAWAEEITNAPLAFGANLGVSALHGVFVLFVLAVCDVARARVFAQDRRFVLGAFGSAFVFALRRPVSTLAIVLVGAALQAGLLWTAGAVTDRTLGPTQAGFFVPFVFGQVFVALRIAVRAGTLLGLARMAQEDLERRTAPREG